MPSSKAHCQNLIILAKQKSLADTFRVVAKEVFGVKSALFSKISEVMDALAAEPQSAIVIDWGIGVSESCELLKKLRPSEIGSPRPILLYGGSDETSIRGAALEYGVSELYTGEISRDFAEKLLTKLLSEPMASESLTRGLDFCRKARKRGDRDAVRTTLVDLYKDNKENELISCELAEDYLGTEEIEEAASVIEPFLNEESPNPKVLSLKGRCLMKQKKFSEAAEVMSKADLINPNDVDRLLLLGRSYLEVFKPERAGRYFKRVLALDPRREDAKKGLGESLLISGNINEALSCLRSLSSEADMASVFNSSAILAIRNGQFAAGMQLYQTAAETVDSSKKDILSKLAFNTGLAYLRQSLAHKAHYYFTIATLLVPEYEKAIRAKLDLDKRLGNDHPLLLAMPEDPVAALLDFESTADECEKESEKTTQQDYDLSF